MGENWAEGEAGRRLAEASLDAVREPLFRIGPDGRFGFVNEAACRSLGYSREELSTMSVSDIDVDFPPMEFPAHWAEVRRAGVLDVEGRHRRKDGSEFPVSLNVRHMKFEGEDFALVSARDISAEKDLQLALMQSETRLRSARRYAGVGFAEWAPGGGEIVWDEETYRIFGYEPHSIKPSYDLVLKHIFPEDRQQFESAENTLLESTELGLEVEYRIEPANGGMRHIREDIAVSRDGTGKVVYATCVVIDVTKSKHAEAELRESQARLVEAQRMARMGEWYLDLVDMRLTYSDQVYELLGVTRENFEASPHGFESLVHPDDREQFHRDIREREAVPESLSYDHRIIRPDGKILYVEQRNEPILDGDGKVIARRGTIQDITEFKKVTLALQEREAALAQAQSISHVGSWFRDMRTGELTYSDEMFCILGIEKDKFSVSTPSFVAMVHPDDRHKLNMAAQHDPANRDEFIYEHRIVQPDGAVRYMDHHSRPVFDSLGTVIGRRGTMQDITERKEMELALGLAQLSLDSAHESIMRCSADGHILYVNPAACRALGYSEEELLELSVPVIADTPPEELQEQWRELRELGSITAERNHRRKDGSLFPVSATITHVQHGDTEFSFVSVRDLSAQKEAELEIQELERRFSQARQNSGFGTWEFQAGTDKYLWSDETYAIVGLELGSAVPNRAQYLTMIHPDDRERTKRLREEMRLRGGEHVVEYRFTRPDGEQRYLEEHGAVTKDAEGQILYITGTLHDITEKKLAEEQLREAEYRLAIARRHARIGTWEWNIETDSGVWSDEVYSIFGHEPGSFAPNYEMFINRVHPADVKFVRAAEQDAMERKGEYEAEYRVITPDGETRYVHDYGVITRRDESGKAIYMTGVVQDISERKRADQALAENERLYRSILDNMADAFYRTNLEGRLVMASRSAEALSGYPLDELIGMPLAKLYRDPEERDRFLALLASSEEGVTGYEAEMKQKDGSFVWVSTNAHYWRDGDGTILGVEGTSRDITSAREVAEQLRQAQKMEAVGQLTGGIAHDFNNLLTVVMGNLEMVAESLKNGSSQQDKVLRSYAAAERGANLTHRLLAFSRKQTLLPTIIDLNQVADSLRDMLRVTLSDAVELSILPAESLWSCRADRTQLENAILNLAINSRDAMPSGGELVIAMENVTLDDAQVEAHKDFQAGDYVMFSVSDTGFGIPPDAIDHVFEPFFSTKDVGAGSGLGLSMIYGFARQSGGHVTIESEVGKGTTVKHYLPRWAPEPSDQLSA